MSLRWAWRGRIAHEVCAAEQRDRRQAILDGAADEVVWLVEHPPTVTVGRRPAPGTPSPEDLAARGIAYSRIERGGLATYHGPGQLIAYPLVRLPERGFTVRAYIHRLEAVVIEWLATLGVHAGRREGAPGVWVSGAKIGALGVHIRRGVSMHGLAVNLTTELSPFGLITPCGLRDAGVTSVAQLGRPVPSMEAAAENLGSMLAGALASH